MGMDGWIYVECNRSGPVLGLNGRLSYPCPPLGPLMHKKRGLGIAEGHGQTGPWIRKVVHYRARTRWDYTSDYRPPPLPRGSCMISNGRIAYRAVHVVFFLLRANLTNAPPAYIPPLFPSLFLFALLLRPAKFYSSLTIRKDGGRNPREEKVGGFSGSISRVISTLLSLPRPRAGWSAGPRRARRGGVRRSRLSETRAGEGWYVAHDQVARARAKGRPTF